MLDGMWKSLAPIAVAASFVIPAGPFVFPAQAGTQSSAPKTVCTITVNSADEKETLAARLPKGQYRFVELLEKGREDWLRSSCQKQVQCDVLVISGHFNAGETFYSDKVDVTEHLKVDELERAACSESCPGLFANLKEVYLFGCESLNPDATKYSSSYGESGRERMRRIFANVPRIYGFSSSAPVGPTAAMLLNRYFDAGGAGAFATGQANGRLLGVFKRNSMTQVSGITRADAAYAERRDVCRFFDERLGAAKKLDAVHQLLRGDMPHARRYFRRMEALFASLSDADRQSPGFQQALARVAADEGARTRFIGFMRNAEPAERARLIELATALHWLDADTRREEQLAWAGDLLARRQLGYGDVDLACNVGKGGDLAVGLDRLGIDPAAARGSQAAVLACLGSAAARGGVLRALASEDERDVQAAQVYLRYHPAVETADLRPVVRDIARMPGSAAQARALEALSRLAITDAQILGDLAQAYAQARTPSVQRAIAEVFIRSGAASAVKPEMAAVFREHRIKAPGGGHDLVDVLLQKLRPTT